MSTASVSTGDVRVVDSGAVRRIVIARPPLNVLTIAMLEELATAIEAAGTADGIRVVLLTGEGPRAFCAGVDVADHTPERVGEMMHAFNHLIGTILRMPLPIIAALNGTALGGGLEVALACDVILARDGVAIGQPEIRLGVFPPVAAVLLPRLVGRQAALDLILSGRTLRTDEARALRLLTATFDSESFESGVQSYADGLAAHSGAVLRLAKRAVDSTAERPLAAALGEADRLYLDELMSLRDAHEGLAAFMEKRMPVWRDA